MALTIAICDDEKNMREEIFRLIKKQCDDWFVDLYGSGNELLASNTDYDIYFLDIQMPGIDGIKTAEALRERQETESKRESVIIFITALREYIEDAFDVKAFHYLIKPINEIKFASVFSRAINDCRKIKENYDNHILIKSGSTYHKIFLKDIYFIESRDKKIILNTTSGAVEYYGKIQEIEDVLGDSFFRSHRCYIVNMAHITRYNANTIYLNNEAEVFLAQKKYPQFVKTYLNFTKNEGLIHG